MKDSTTAFGWPKNSFYSDAFDSLIRDMAENGYFMEENLKQLHRFYGNPCEMQPDTTANFSSMDMTDLTGVLALYARTESFLRSLSLLSLLK